jgi:ergothioneine biosynthesis protein EgtB
LREGDPARKGCEVPRPSDEELLAALEDARARTIALAASLAPDQLVGPRLAIVNPPLWELGHVAWFQERWALRRDGAPPLLPRADELYDSAAVAHDRRWSLPLPSLADTLGYLRAVAARVAALVPSLPEGDRYFVRLGILHEDMHAEAMAFTRQTLGYPAPALPGSGGEPAAGRAGGAPGDAAIPGGTWRLGAIPGEEPFVFDNEKWAHPVELRPFAIARAPVTQREYRAFVEEGGYARRELWSEPGWAWRTVAGADGPAYWVRQGGEWTRREFDRLVPLHPDRPMVHVSWFEADAYCRFAGRRLPTEAEWEAAAAGEPGSDGRLAAVRRRHPWGAAPPTPERAHLDVRALAPVDVGGCPAGDSAFGCRQLLGNVWEWTASDFLPYPGFAPDPYREYSQPWFGTHRVLKGGSFATPSRLIRTGFRNFYTPDRRDPWAGFRTCAR